MNDKEIILGGDESIWKDYAFMLHYATKTEKKEYSSDFYDLCEETDMSYSVLMKRLVEKYRYIIDRPELSAEELRDEEEDAIVTQYLALKEKATEVEMAQINNDYHASVERIVENRQSPVDLMAEIVKKYQYILER